MIDSHIKQEKVVDPVVRKVKESHLKRNLTMPLKEKNRIRI